jgi:hypothetical protein
MSCEKNLKIKQDDKKAKNCIFYFQFYVFVEKHKSHSTMKIVFNIARRKTIDRTAIKLIYVKNDWEVVEKA